MTISPYFRLCRSKVKCDLVCVISLLGIRQICAQFAEYLLGNKFKLSLGFERVTASEIKATRRQLSLNQAQFAQLLGVHPITVSKWERDETKPTYYQTTLLEHFSVGAKDAEVRNSVGTLLVGMGVGIALALLLRHLIKS